MTAFASINFPCPQCGAKFALTDKIASRKIKCPCGQVFRAPAMPDILPDAEPYDLHLVHQASAEGAALKSGGFNSATLDSGQLNSTGPGGAASIASRAQLYPHRGIRSFSTDDSEREFSVVRDRIVPIGLLTAGLALRIGEIPFDRTLGHGAAVAAAVMIFQLILSTACMLAGVLLAARILSANYGPIGTALLKLCGMAIFAWAFGAVIVIWLQFNIRAFVIALHVIFLIYAVGFAALFSLDMQESLISAVTCAAFQNAAALVVFFGNR